MEELFFSIDGQYILGRTQETIIEWSAKTGRLLQSFGKANLKPLAMKMIANKLHVALSEPLRLAHAEYLSWRLNHKLLSTTLSKYNEEITQSVWRGTDLITSNQQGEIAIWDMNTRSQVLSFIGHQNRVTHLELHPNANKFFSGATDGSVSLWTIDEGRALARLQGHDSKITTMSTQQTSQGVYLVSGDQRAGFGCGMSKVKPKNNGVLAAQG